MEDENEVKENNQQTIDYDDEENPYHLISNAEEEKEEVREEAVYHVLERPGDEDNDYEDPDNENLFMNSIQGRAQ